jgi:hypothetical protein
MHAVVNSMRDKAKRLFLPTKSQYGLHRFVRFPGDRGKYVSFNGMCVCMCECVCMRECMCQCSSVCGYLCVSVYVIECVYVCLCSYAYSFIHAALSTMLVVGDLHTLQLYKVCTHSHCTHCTRRVRIYTLTYIDKYTHTLTHTCIYIYSHTYTHVYIYTHTHTHTLVHARRGAQHSDQRCEQRRHERQ